MVLGLLGLSILFLLLRLPRLRGLPIFGDEAIFLRLAQLIRENAQTFLWASLQEASPPLHPWLLALSLGLSSDPVTSGRLLSVIAGLLTVPAVFVLARDLVRLSGAPAGSERAGFLAAVLVIFCPFAALAQRMARVDALFLLECVVVAWLSLRTASNPSPRHGVLLGVALGLTMLTRQNYSYLLWLSPLLAWWWLVRKPGDGRLGAPALIRAMAPALLIAFVLWAPMLATREGPDLGTRIFHHAGARPSMAPSERLTLAGRAAADSIVWMWSYLTPPVAIFSACSLAWLLFKRKRVGGFLLSWILLFWLPGAFVAAVFFPRYVLPILVPLLIASALALSGISLRSRSAAAGLLLILLLWPARDLAIQITDWRRQNLVPIDRWQFVSGWPAGYATEQALRHLEMEASKGPIAVITSPHSGNPTDTVWLYSPSNALSLYSATSFEEELLPPGPEPGTFRLRGDPRRLGPTRAVRLPGGVRVLHLTTEEVITPRGAGRAAELLGPRNPDLQRVARFENPRDTDGPIAAVVIYRVR